MGYYSTFEVSVRPLNPEDPLISFDELDTKFGEVTDYGLYPIVMQDQTAGSLEGAKWYEHDDDAITLSHLWSGYLITVRRFGEEHDDIEQRFYVDGKSHQSDVVLTFSPFDPSKLA